MFKRKPKPFYSTHGVDFYALADRELLMVSNGLRLGVEMVAQPTNVTIRLKPFMGCVPTSLRRVETHKCMGCRGLLWNEKRDFWAVVPSKVEVSIIERVKGMHNENFSVELERHVSDPYELIIWTNSLDSALRGLIDTHAENLDRTAYYKQLNER